MKNISLNKTNFQLFLESFRFIVNILFGKPVEIKPNRRIIGNLALFTGGAK